MRTRRFANQISAWSLGACALLAVQLGGCRDNNQADPRTVSSDAGDAHSPDTGSDLGTDVTFDQDASAPDASEPADAADTRTPPPTPFAITLNVEPARAFYSPGTLVEFAARVTGTDGAVMAGVPLVWSTDPETAVSGADGSYTLEHSGRITFSACAGEVCGASTIAVDSGPPVLSIESPSPGAELLAEESPLISVVGTVTDDSAQVSVFVNGAAVPVADGQFSTEISPRMGVNHIVVEATDGIRPQTARTAVDVMWAPEYVLPYDPDAETAVEIANTFEAAIRVRMNQSMLDGGGGWNLDPETGAPSASDLVGVVEMVLASVDLLSQVPDPLVASDEVSLRITAIDLGDTDVAVEFTDDGAQFFVQIPALRAFTEGSFDLAEPALSLDGSITAAIAAQVSFSISKPDAETPLTAEVTSFDVALEEATSEFDAPEADAIFAVAEGLLFSLVETALVGALEPAIVDALPPVIEGLFESVDGALRDVSFPIDLGLGEPVELRLNAPVETVLTRYRSGLDAVLSATVGISGEREHPSSRGVAISGPNTAEIFGATAVGMTLDMALVNGLLHALWDGGLLDLDIGDLLPPELAFVVERAELDGLLPPLITAPTVDLGDFDLLISLGEAHLILGRGEQEDVVGMHLSAAIGFDLVDDQILVRVQESPQLDTWLISSSGDAPIFADPSALSALIEGVVWPQLTGAISDGLALDVPTIDGGALGDLAPELAGLVIGFVLEEQPVVRDGGLIIGMGIRASATPAGPDESEE